MDLIYSDYGNWDGEQYKYSHIYARPALNIDLSSVILTSAATGGKDPGTGGVGVLEGVDEFSGNDWKLTILDASRSDFTASAGANATLSVTEGYDSWTVPITYSNAKTGSNKEHVSAILTDGNGNALYYGYIATNSAASTTGVNVTIPTGLSPGTYTLNVCSEQCNGDKMTDYSSPISTIELTVIGKVDEPAFFPEAETYTEAQDVSISCATEGATIHYTTDGTTPTTTSPTYNSAITVNKTTTIKAIAVKDGMVDSEVAEATYTIKVVTPAFFPEAETYTEAQDVSISCATEGATIHYTTDGTPPTATSPTYNNAITVNKTTTIKAIAVKDGMADSEVAEATYTIKVVTPTFFPEAGTYTEAQNVEISCTTDGTDIYYTTNGNDPDETSDIYSSAITVSEGMTIKAVGIKHGWTNSEIAKAVYTIEEPPAEYWTVTFDPNASDASGKMDPQQIEKGKSEKLKANKYTREGFTFDSWNTKKDGSGTKYADKASFKPKGDTTLYAQWKEVKKYSVTVTADPANGGTVKSSVASGKSGTKVTLKAVSDAGYKFKKWKVVSGGVKLSDATKAKTTFKIKNANVKVKAIFEKIYEAPQPEIEPKGKDKIVLAWSEVSDAKGYDIFMSRCNHGGKEITPKLIKTIKNKNTTQWTVTGLKPNKSYKAIIKAYTKDKNGKKKYISKSPLMHFYTAGGTKNYTNAKSIKLDKSDGKIKKGNKLTLKVKDTYNIKASVKKADKKKKLMPDSHVKTLRYRSSDPGVASVGASGKITAKKPGKCKIYVYAHNGVNKTINLTVK